VLCTKVLSASFCQEQDVAGFLDAAHIRFRSKVTVLEHRRIQGQQPQQNKHLDVASGVEAIKLIDNLKHRPLHLIVTA
jgi:hypothetical protein